MILVSDRKKLLEEYAVNAALIKVDQASMPLIEAFVADLREREWVSGINVEGNSIKILASDVPQGKEQLLPLLVEYGIQISHYEWVRPSLEEIFLEISR